MAKKGDIPKKKKSATDIDREVSQKPSSIEKDVFLAIPKRSMGLSFREKILPQIIRAYFQNQPPEDYRELREYAVKAANNLSVPIGVVLTMYCRIAGLIRKYEDESPDLNDPRKRRAYAFNKLHEEAESIYRMLNPPNRWD